MTQPTVRIRATLLAFGALAAACSGERTPPAARAADQAAPPPAAGERVYVTNEDDQDLSVIDAATDSVIATIPVGTRPRGVHVGPDGRVFVALSGSPKCPPSMPDAECARLTADKSKDGIAVVDIAARRVERFLPGGSDPENFAVSADGTRLFVSNEDANAASVVDVATGKIVATVPVGREPEGVGVRWTLRALTLPTRGGRAERRGLRGSERVRRRAKNGR
jgi:YVTN family beta-propeller protein